MTKKDKLNLVWQDLSGIVDNWSIWSLLSWQDIRLRYRRSYLGPFWLTISMAITIYSIGFLYAYLFKVDVETYFPHLACGLLSWTLIVNIINESTNCFIDAVGYLRQIKLPYVIFIMRVVVRNVIIFCHNIVAIIPVIIFCPVNIGWWLIALPFGLFIIVVNGVVYGIVLAMLGARFRDINQIVTSFMQVVFFITPVMWMEQVLPTHYQFMVKFNPFGHFINLIRAPLLGTWPGSYCYLTTLSIGVIGIILMLLIYYRGRHRIIYWL
jgi:lipopolysaccharide transport system permease protein